MRNARRDAVCTWCKRPPSEVSKLIAGPNVFICDACVEAGERTLTGSGGQRGALTRLARRTARLCSFCYRPGSAKRPLIVGPANICDACLHACREILDARAS